LPSLFLIILSQEILIELEGLLLLKTLSSCSVRALLS
jgi:hypothetical protein